MDQLIKSYIDFCVQLENQYEGVTKLVCAGGEIQLMEDVCTIYYNSNNFAEFVNCINGMRALYISKSNQMTQGELAYGNK